MCSIIGLVGSRKKLAFYFNNENRKKFLIDSLKIKGTDEISATVIINGMSKYIKNATYNKFDNIKKLLIYDSYNKDDICRILFFSRFPPEMESNKTIIPQPYYNKHDGYWYAVHGTIPKAEEFGNINIDTEIFQYASNITESISFVEKQGGKISLFGFNEEDELSYKSYTNGLGMYKYLIKQPPLESDIVMFSNLNLEVKDDIISKIELKNNIQVYTPKTRIISLFSGGLDITCSTWKTIDKYKDQLESVDLWYFDWGTNASVQEVESVKLMQDKINKFIYKDTPLLKRRNIIEINHEIIEAKDMFSNILEACNMNRIRLTDENAEGAGSHEAEAAISYVPMRNTFLLTLAAAKAEQLYPNDKCIFVIGANLSEGMIYLDNSETFINRMNKLLKVSGQSSYNFEVYAPYVNKTKTSMIEDAIENGYDFEDSFSCYFPKKNGDPCGKCGSCLLREEAIKRANR